MKPEVEVIEINQKDMSEDFLCPFCKKGTMVPVDEERDVPTYVCLVCGAYHGEFLHTGKVFYYTPLHLRVGQAIIARDGMGGRHSISSLSVELSHVFSIECTAEEVAGAILYLERNGVISTSDGHVSATVESNSRKIEVD